jgi:hypothetical protein
VNNVLIYHVLIYYPICFNYTLVIYSRNHVLMGFYQSSTYISIAFFFKRKKFQEKIHKIWILCTLAPQIQIIKNMIKKDGVSVKHTTIDKLELVDINSIKEHPKNSEIYSKSRNSEDDELMENIKLYGLLQPIVIDINTNYIISGNRRYKCCKKLGMNKIQVIRKNIKYDVINLINFNKYRDKTQVERVNEYRVLKQEIKKLGYIDRKKIMEGISMRDYIFQQTGTSQTQNYRLEYIEQNNLTLYNQVLIGQISISHAYHSLKGLKNVKNTDTKNELLIIEKGIEKVSPFVDKNTILELIDRIYD